MYQAPAGADNVAPSGSSTSGVVGGGGADGDRGGDLSSMGMHRESSTPLGDVS